MAFFQEKNDCQIQNNRVDHTYTIVLHRFHSTQDTAFSIDLAYSIKICFLDVISAEEKTPI